MSATLEVKLSDEQLEALAERIYRKLAKGQSHNKPQTVAETAKALGISEATVRRRIESGAIRAVQGIGIPRVSQAEIRRLLGEPNDSDE